MKPELDTCLMALLFYILVAAGCIVIWWSICMLGGL